MLNNINNMKPKYTNKIWIKSNKSKKEKNNLKLKRLFLHYSLNGDKFNADYIKSHNFLKLIKDLKMEINDIDIDILFAKESKNRHLLNFEDFKIIIKKISEKQNNLFNYYIIPLYHKIFANTNFKKLENLIKKTINYEVLNIFYNYFDLIAYLYETYFQNEIKHVIFNNKYKSILDESKSILYQFCKNFCLLNNYISHFEFILVFEFIKDISKEKLTKILNFKIKNNLKLGTELTLIKFMIFICKILEISLINNQNEIIDNNIYFKLFFELLKNTKGFNALYSLNNYSKIKNISIRNNNSNNTSNNIKNIINSNIKLFENIFNYYSNKLNKQKLLTLDQLWIILNPNKLKKIWINKNSLNKLFIKFAKNKIYLDFKGFWSLIYNLNEEIDDKMIKNDLNLYIEYLLDKFTLIDKKLNSSFNKIISNLLKNKKIKQIYLGLVDILSKIFYFYSNDSKFLDFNWYFKFLKEFNIFPDIVKKKEMSNIFHNLCNLEKKISLPKFTKIIIVISNICNKDEIDDISKLIFLLEKIEYSDALKNFNEISSNKLSFNHLIKS